MVDNSIFSWQSPACSVNCWRNVLRLDDEKKFQIDKDDTVSYPLWSVSICAKLSDYKHSDRSEYSMLCSASTSTLCQRSLSPLFMACWRYAFVVIAPRVFVGRSRAWFFENDARLRPKSRREESFLLHPTGGGFSGASGTVFLKRCSIAGSNGISTVRWFYNELRTVILGQLTRKASRVQSKANISGVEGAFF